MSVLCCLSLADFASDRRDRSLWIKAAVNIAEQRLVLPLLAGFFFWVGIAIAVVLEKLHTDTENLVGTGSQGLLPWSEEAGGTKVIGTRYERRTTKNEAYRFQWRKKKKKKVVPSLSRPGTKEEEKTEGKDEGITGWLAVLGTCAGCSRVLSKEARYVSVSFDSFFCSRNSSGEKARLCISSRCCDHQHSHNCASIA